LQAVLVAEMAKDGHGWNQAVDTIYRGDDSPSVFDGSAKKVNELGIRDDGQWGHRWAKISSATAVGGRGLDPSFPIGMLTYRGAGLFSLMDKVFEETATLYQCERLLPADWPKGDHWEQVWATQEGAFAVLDAKDGKMFLHRVGRSLRREHIHIKRLDPGDNVVTTKMRVAELGTYRGYQGERRCLVFGKLL
jgi:hypothetical protein